MSNFWLAMAVAITLFGCAIAFKYWKRYRLGQERKKLRESLVERAKS